MNDYFVVTGGGSGMGRDIALRLAEGGNDVLVVGRRNEPLRQTAALAANGTIDVFSADLSAADGATALRDHVGDRTIAGLVTAAGGQGSFVAGGSDPVEVRDRWDAAMAKNFYSALLPVETLAPALADERGRVVLISSTAALDGSGGPYASAKAALTGYGMDLAQRLGPRGITVNVVAPGFVADTEFFEAGGFGSADAVSSQAAEATLVGRVGTSADITHVVLALLDRNAGWTTGQVISPNGGTVMVR